MKRVFALILALLLLAGCGGIAPANKESRTVFAMDTVMSLTVYGAGSAGTASLDAAEAEIGRLDQMLSVSDPESDIARLNASGMGTVSEETAGLLTRALEVSAMTGGAYDPTLGELMEAWGFRSGSYRIPPEDEISALLNAVGAEKVSVQGSAVEIPAGMGLDLGGIAKGYTSEQVLRVMEEAGAEAAVVSLGGNVGTLGQKPDGSPWSVAIESPEESEDYAAILSLEGGLYAITSGSYERYFEQDGVTYHHILDPQTGRPAALDLKSVTVVSTDGTLADGLSTALFVMGLERAVDFWRQHSGAFQLVLITEETIYATAGLTITSARPVITLEEMP